MAFFCKSMCMVFFGSQAHGVVSIFFFCNPQSVNINNQCHWHMETGSSQFLVGNICSFAAEYFCQSKVSQLCMDIIYDKTVQMFCLRLWFYQTVPKSLIMRRNYYNKDSHGVPYTKHLFCFVFFSWWPFRSCVLCVLKIVAIGLLCIIFRLMLILHFCLTVACWMHHVSVFGSAVQEVEN